MNVGLKITVRDEEATGRLRSLLAGLEDRTGIHEDIATVGREATRNYLLQLNRHTTARTLGASPSGHWEKAAEQTEGSATREAASISVAGPGISRAFQDVNILPGPGKKYLALPKIAEAYNQRASRVPDLIAIFQKFGGGLLIKKELGQKLGTIWYVLVKSVHQRQDRTLLPSDETFAAMARRGAVNYLNRLFPEGAV